MNIKQGKSNIKYLFIVVVLTAIVGGQRIAGRTEEEMETAETGLTLEKLKNAAYSIPHSPVVKLKDGSGYFEKYPAKLYEDKVAFGDLNNDKKEDAVVLLGISFRKLQNIHSYYLCIMINDKGKPSYLTSNYLRTVIVNSIVIESGLINLDLLVQKPGKGLHATAPRSFKYKLFDDKLIEVVERKTRPLEIEIKRLLPLEAKIIDVQRLKEISNSNRALVLWMINSEQHSKIDYIHSCPEYGQGSVYIGPTRASLVDTKKMSIINTVKILRNKADSMSISY